MVRMDVGNIKGKYNVHVAPHGIPSIVARQVDVDRRMHYESLYSCS